MPWIFSYAEFGPGIVEKTLSKAPLVSLPASLENHTVVFKGKSRKWGGGVADIERKKGKIVYGSILLVTPEEVKLVDRYYQLYERKLMPIYLDATRDKFKAQAYVLKKEADYSAPSDDYCKSIVKHLRFFWGGKTLEDYGISKEPAEKKRSNPKPKQDEKVVKTKAKTKEKINRKPVRRKKREKSSK